VDSYIRLHTRISLGVLLDRALAARGVAERLAHALLERLRRAPEQAREERVDARALARGERGVRERPEAKEVGRAAHVAAGPLVLGDVRVGRDDPERDGLGEGGGEEGGEFGERVCFRAGEEDGLVLEAALLASSADARRRRKVSTCLRKHLRCSFSQVLPRDPRNPTIAWHVDISVFTFGPEETWSPPSAPSQLRKQEHAPK
jgi:hypothetical protein